MPALHPRSEPHRRSPLLKLRADAPVEGVLPAEGTFSVDLGLRQAAIQVLPGGVSLQPAEGGE